MIVSKLFLSLVVMQILLGMIVPLGIMVAIRLFSLNEELRKLLYFMSAILIQLGIFSTRWNIVMGGQMFSKSFRGLMTYKLELMGIEGLFSAIGFLILPLVFLAILLKILPPWQTLEENPPR
jgi:predicted membrane protein